MAGEDHCRKIIADGMCHLRLRTPCSGKKKDLKKCGVVGIQTLISKSQERDDSFLAELQSLLATSGDNASVTCHKTCYSSYTSTSRNVSVTNKRKAGDLPHIDEPARRTTRSQLSDFIFKPACFVVWFARQRTKKTHKDGCM